jgi:hypothetical protein
VEFYVRGASSSSTDNLKARVYNDNVDITTSTFRSSIDMTGELGGVTIANAPDTYTLQSFNFVAAGSTSTISFLAEDPSGGDIYLDTVSVDIVPEPSAFALAALGLLSVIGLGRRRKR